MMRPFLFHNHKSRLEDVSSKVPGSSQFLMLLSDAWQLAADVL